MTRDNSYDPIEHLDHHDGTSQHDRTISALDTDYVHVDERTLQDWLRFTHRFAQQLAFIDAQSGVQDGTWANFLGPDPDYDQIAAFVDNPTLAASHVVEKYGQPHVALFLTFLKLLQNAQAQLNTFTERHLDYYYRQVLGLTERKHRPDHIHLLIELARGIKQAELPAGTRLNAGTDSQGRPLQYEIDQTGVFNQAQVAEIRSLIVDRRITDIRDAYEHPSATNEHPFLKMLSIAFGHPAPGDLVRLPPSQSDLGDFLDSAWKTFAEIRNPLFLDAVQNGDRSNYDPLRALMHYYDNEIGRADSHWAEINNDLRVVSKRRGHAWVIDPLQRRNFERNLLKALDGNAPTDDAAMKQALRSHFKGIEFVENVDELYELLLQEEKATPQSSNRAEAWITTQLGFEINSFRQTIKRKREVDTLWANIFPVLRAAAKRAKQPYAADRFTDDLRAEHETFERNLQLAISPHTDVASLSAVLELLDEVEDTFYMRAEQFAYLMRLHVKGDKATRAEWERGYDILDAAHTQMAHADRRDTLREIYETKCKAAGDLGPLWLAVLGDNGTGSAGDPFARLLSRVDDRDDERFLRAIERKQGQALSDEEERNLFELLERIQSDLEQFTSVAQTVEWLNLLPNLDATAQLAPTPDHSRQEARWRTFGSNTPTDVEAQPVDPSFGWAISSPLLQLSAGERHIVLTLSFEDAGFHADTIDQLLNKNPKPFQIELSTAKGFVTVDGYELQLVTSKADLDTLYTKDNNICNATVQPTQQPVGSGTVAAEPLRVLHLSINLDAKFDPVAPLSTNDESIADPTLRLLLKPAWDAARQHYCTPLLPFAELQLALAHLHVAVNGLLPAQLRNDEGDLNPAKPFAPFGSQAVAGARLQIAHPETAIKPLDCLAFHGTWKGVPDSNLSNHYRNYGTVSGNDVFKVAVSMVTRQVAREVKSKQRLFADDAKAALEFSVSISDDELLTSEQSAETPWQRYIQWELGTPDFQHAIYPKLALQKALELSAAIANGETIDPANYQVNPPYTPVLKQLTLGYRASSEIVIAKYAGRNTDDHIYHIEPFGYREIEPDGVTIPFLPAYPHAGELLIGLSGIDAPQNISLLFQMVDDSADPDLAQAPLAWSYLDGNRWRTLEDGKLLHDGTGGLIHSGIIHFALTPAATGTLLPADRYWLRCTADGDSRSIADTVAIHTQAVSATLVEQDNADDHFAHLLPPNSVKGLTRRLPAFKSIQQPYSSFGGRRAEASERFNIRVSERLRHKDRALTIWDYERLVLDHFPEIYKAKCLPAQPQRPGEVHLVVIPDIRHKHPADPFAPQVSAAGLASIEAFLAPRMPAVATLVVKNAIYIPVMVRIAVRLRAGYDAGFYRQRVHDDIQRALSPWAFDSAAEIMIGHRIYANTVVNFLEEQPYVDYVAHIRLFIDEDGDGMRLIWPPQPKGYYVETVHPDGVLSAARAQEVNLIETNDYHEDLYTGIGYMRIELDFIVG